MTRRDEVVFGVGVLVLALHATLDSFLAPEPGTDWRDHLLRGSMTLGLLLVSFLVYRRSRAGVRATLAIVLGVLALEGALLAILDARAVGARGEDWTGFLLLPVGVALLTLGILLLWRSRKPHGRRYVRRVLIAMGAALAAFWLLLPVALAIGVTHRPRADA